MKKTNPFAAVWLSGGLKLCWAVLIGVAAAGVMLSGLRHRRGSRHLPGFEPPGHPMLAPAPLVADRGSGSDDTYSVAGEEDPGAAVDSPTPPPNR